MRSVGDPLGALPGQPYVLTIFALKPRQEALGGVIYVNCVLTS